MLTLSRSALGVPGPEEGCFNVRCKGFCKIRQIGTTGLFLLATMIAIHNKDGVQGIATSTSFRQLWQRLLPDRHPFPIFLFCKGWCFLFEGTRGPRTEVFGTHPLIDKCRCGSEESLQIVESLVAVRSRDAHPLCSTQPHWHGGIGRPG